MRMPTRFISHTKGSSSTKLDGEKGTGSILESIFDASFVKRILSSNRSSEMSGETTATSMSLQLPYVPFAYEPKRYADWMRIPRVFSCRRNSLVLSIIPTLISATRRPHLFWLVLSLYNFLCTYYESFAFHQGIETQDGMLLYGSNHPVVHLSKKTQSIQPV